MRMTHNLILLFIAALLGSARAGGGMVGPGAMAPYGGGGGRRRHGGYVRVQDPAKGFFIAGSTIMEMNGLYGRVNSVPADLGQVLQLAYKHDKTNWLMCLTSGKATGKKEEWLLIDDQNRQRFMHEGRTIIPGSGKRWRHLHRSAKASEASDSTSSETSTSTALQSHGDDYSELPWQVIAILDESMLNKLRRYQAHHFGNIRRALTGGNLPPTEKPHLSQPPPYLDGTPASVGEPDAVDICANNEDGLRAAESLFGALLDANGGSSDKSRWTRAQVYLQLAQCYRRTGRDPTKGLEYIGKSLKLFPSFKSALFQRGLLLLDAGGRAKEAAISFAQVLRLDRAFPRIDEWLIRAEAQERRTAERAKSVADEIRISNFATADCKAWRQTANCDPEHGSREPEFDQPCNAVIPPGVSGFCECMSPPLDKTGEKGSEYMVRFKRVRNLIKKASAASCDKETFVCQDECQKQWQDTIQLDGGDDAVQKQIVEYLLAWKDQMKRDDEERERDRKTAQANRNSLNSNFLSTARKTAWETSDHYGVLGLAQDFTKSELKRAYRRRSLQNHPDKKGGSDEAFQRVGAAHACLSDDALRQDYDMGKDLDSPDKEELTHRENIERRYFPERFGFHPFGDPLEDHPDGQEAHRQHQERIEAARQRNAAAIGQGTKSEL